MNPHRTRRLTSLAAIAAVALLAGACTGTGNAEPTLPPGTPTETTTTPSPTATQTPTVAPTVSSSPTSRDTPPPTDAELVELVNVYRNITLDLPELPVDEARQYVADTTTELTTPNGSARQLMDDVIGDTGLITRGRPYTTILDQPQPDGPEWTATGCIATRGRTTQIETGDNTEDEGFISDYTEVDLRVAPDDDGSWLLAGYEPDQERLCVPPDVEAEIRAQWDSYREALSQWWANGRPESGLESIRAVTTGALLEDLEGSVGASTADINSDVEYGLEFSIVFPDRVTTIWCRDVSRDPDATFTDRETGEVERISEDPEPPALTNGRWVLVDGVWKLTTLSDIYEGTEDAPEEHRCYA